MIPNPWDAGSARVLDALGFRALATTSSGFAFTLGRLDGAATLDEVVDHVAALARATNLPVSVDLEDGHGATLESRFPASRRRARSVGRSRTGIESASTASTRRSSGFTAAVAAARAVGFPFTLTARAENYIRGNPDLEDTIARLQAFESAGADVLYAPGLSDLDEIRAALRRRLEAGERACASEPDVSGARRRRSPARQRRRIAHVGGGAKRSSRRRPRSATGATSPCSARALPQTGSSPLKSGRAASLGMPPSP